MEEDQRELLGRLYSIASNTHSYVPQYSVENHYAGGREAETVLSELEEMNYVERREMRPKLLCRRRSRRRRTPRGPDSAHYRVTEQGRDSLRGGFEAGQTSD
jgi:hypothetical protein